MEKLKETIIKIIETAEQSGKGHFGLRAESEFLEIGAGLNNSYQNGDTWDGEELDGTCAVKLYSYDGFCVDGIESDFENVKMYLEDDMKIVLIGGTSSYEGTDAHETVIENAEVLYVF